MAKKVPEWEVRDGKIFQELYADGKRICILPEDLTELIRVLMHAMDPVELTAFIGELVPFANGDQIANIATSVLQAEFAQQ